ncbi:hypothetical protein V6N13_000791 [Hibiscus sabdariffa]
MGELSFTEAEVWEVIRGGCGSKAPGPDGYILEFYKKDTCMCFGHETANGSSFAWCGGVVVKIDFAKAYDCVRWEFLFQVLHAMGFGERWCRWIRECVCTVRLAVLLNGSVTWEFAMRRGLWQGDPLSPLLFVLVTEFANDTLFLLKGEVVYARHLKQLCFQQCSGLKINFAKSNVFAIGVLDSVIEEFAGVLGCAIGSLPSTYLGLSMGVDPRGGTV